MSLITALSLLGVMLLLAAMPSASVALVVTRSATHGVANGVAVAVGIVLADLLFVMLAILGMSFLAETLGSLFAILKVAGGAYLIWLGVVLIRAKGGLALGANGPNRRSLFASCAAGFVLTLGDVKAILFYASLFPTFVDMKHLEIQDVAVIMLVTIVAVGGVKTLYALAAKKIVMRIQNQSAQRLTRSAAGCAMVGAGTYLITKA